MWRESCVTELQLYGDVNTLRTMAELCLVDSPRPLGCDESAVEDDHVLGAGEHPEQAVGVEEVLLVGADHVADVRVHRHAEEVAGAAEPLDRDAVEIGAAGRA